MVALLPQSSPLNFRRTLGGQRTCQYSFSCNLVLAFLGPRNPDLCFDVPLRFVVALARNIRIPRETRCVDCASSMQASAGLPHVRSTNLV